MQLHTLEKRIRALEIRSAKRPILHVHETETVQPIGTSSDYVTTHANDYEVFVAPLRLYGKIQVFRASASVRSNVQDGTVAEFGLAVYKDNNTSYDSENPIATNKPFSLRRVAILGGHTHAETGDAATQVASRFNADLVREVVLDPRAGQFFVAFAANTYAKWLCPGQDLGGTAERKGRKTGYIGEHARDFPEEISVNADSAPVPWIALRSTLGVRIYGDVAEYE